MTQQKAYFFLFFLLLFLFIPTSPTPSDQPQQQPLAVHPLPTLQEISRSQPIIINHTCVHIEQIPDYWIEKAKSEFRMAYGHTSHGSQIKSGMEILMSQSGLYAFNWDGSDGALSFHDRRPDGDLGNPNRTEWASRTRTLLDDPNCNRNIIMWAWCGQVSWADEGKINTYLNLMNDLEEDYPDVTFVYMTGHLDGTGESGNLHLRNEQIRQYCRQNNKVLFDFADIESYDPDGNYFLDKMADDGCHYDSNGDGTQDANWADEWCAAHPGECASCSCAHSHCLNCQQKGKAFWWMMARLAGWTTNGCDRNNDGYIDYQDFLEMRQTTQQQLDDWIQNCWNPKASCGDINADGTVNQEDLDQKQDTENQKLHDWAVDCGFQKKGRIKR